MRPHPKWRKSIKRSGAAICLLIFASWCASLKWDMGVRTRRGALYKLSGGQAILAVPEESVPGSTRWFVSPCRIQAEWQPYFMNADFGKALLLPLWIPCLLTLIPTSIAYRLDLLANRLASAGGCPACGYSLKGISPGSPCPECGQTHAPELSPPASR
jgi:hypothetical protein